MAQLGRIRHILFEDGTFIRVVADVNIDQTIRGLSLMHASGDTEQAVKKLEELKTEYVGKPHEIWENAA